MAHVHGVYDTDQHFTIDKYTRNIVDASDVKKVIKQGDHNSERFSFDMPRYIDKHDMSLCNSVNIHYINTNGKDTSKSVYEVDDLKIDPDNNDMVVFTWLISREATMYAGSLSFAISFDCITNGISDYSWSAGINADVTIGENINNGEAVIAKYADVLAKWKQELVYSGIEGLNIVDKALSDAIANLASAEENSKNAIEAKGVAVLATIPDEYTDLNNKADYTYRNAASVIEQTSEGEIIFAKDSANMFIRGFNVYGKSTQVRTTGAQIFNSETMITKTAGGAIVTNNADGSFTISGSGTITETFNHTYNVPHKETVALLKSGALKLKCDKVTIPYFIARLNVNDSTVVSIQNQYNAEDEVEIKQEWLDDESSYLRFTFYGPLNATIVPGTIKPMLYQDGNGTWEPYTNGEASPSPEYPQDIVSIENPTVNICSKNLLAVNETTKVSGGVTFSVNDDGSITASGTSTATCAFVLCENFTFKAGLTYVLTGCPLGGGNETYRIDNMDKLADDGMGGRAKYNSDTIKPIRIRIASGVTLNNVKFYPMICLSETEDGVFEKGNNQTIMPNCLLSGIPVESNGNYTDANGQRWICDEVDFERGVYIQRVTSKIFTLKKETYDFSPLGYRYTHHVGSGFALEDICLCVTLPYNEAVGTAVETTDGIRINTGAGYVVAQYTDTEGIRETIDLDVLYILPVPIETPLTAEELLAYKELYTNYPVTTVTNDSAAHMKLTYAADTKTYIDNKFAELSAMISNNA